MAVFELRYFARAGGGGAGGAGGRGRMVVGLG